MRSRSPFSALRLISLGLLLVAVILTALQLVRFSRVRSFLPGGLTIAGVPVGNLDRQQAAQRLLEAYNTPVELHFQDAIIHLNPATIDFQLDTERMLAVAEITRTQTSFWSDFWDYLWNRSKNPPDVPLSSHYSDQRLRIYLQELSERYDQPAMAPKPVAGTVNFEPVTPGLTLDIDNSVVLIDNALHSLLKRSLDLPLRRTNPPRPAFQNLEILLHQTLQVSGFEGVAGVYLQDLQSGQEIHFVNVDGQDVPVKPDVAFTASSMIKIPIMVSTYRRLGGIPDEETAKLLSDMIEKSGNEAADWLMKRVIDPRRAPLVVTEDMQALGLNNTFLAGYFSFGSPLLAQIKTPANQRGDVNTDPDIYSQTTPSDLGMLLADIYQCAQADGGALKAAFGSQISQVHCQDMNTFLVNNRLPSLLTAGIPEGTQIAHKHGWVSDINGIINTIGDAGIIYSVGGNYVMVVFLHNQDQLLWDPASLLIAELSRAAYNYFNLSVR